MVFLKLRLIRIAVMLFVLGVIVCLEGCGSGYEVIELDGHVYLQRKSWWKKVIFGP